MLKMTVADSYLIIVAANLYTAVAISDRVGSLRPFGLMFFCRYHHHSKWKKMTKTKNRNRVASVVLLSWWYHHQQCYLNCAQQQLMMTIWLLSVVVNFLADKRLQMKQKTAQECDCGNDCAWKETMKRLCVWSSHAQVVTACCNAQLMQGTSNITNSLKKKKCVTRDSLKREKIRSVW